MAKESSLFAVRIDHKNSAGQLVSGMMAASDQAKKNPLQLAMEYARLAAGPGRISPDDFIRLRLFDGSMYSGADLQEFVGAKRYRDICFSANYRHDWLGMLYNKIASTSYLLAYGLPVIANKVIYAPYAKVDSPVILRDRNELEQFLLRPENYPLFGKPAESQNSLGSIALSECTSAHAHDLAVEIDAHYQSGYLFQDIVMPHRTIAPLSGGHLATVRLMTIAGADGPRVFRACWKIPSVHNAADNYWRPGNLLAQLDKTTGRVMRVTSGVGLDMQEHAAHPDTKIPLVGFVHPEWERMVALALESARVMRAIPLIGWDIACAESGPVIVEMNEHPDSFLMQFADRRGLLDGEFKDFIEFQKRERAAFRSKMKASTQW